MQVTHVQRIRLYFTAEVGVTSLDTLLLLVTLIAIHTRCSDSDRGITEFRKPSFRDGKNHDCCSHHGRTSHQSVRSPNVDALESMHCVYFTWTTRGSPAQEEGNIGYGSNEHRASLVSDSDVKDLHQCRIVLSYQVSIVAYHRYDQLGVKEASHRLTPDIVCVLGESTTEIRVRESASRI